MEKYLTVKYGEEVAARVRTNRSLTVEEIMYCAGYDLDDEQDCTKGLLDGIPGFYLAEDGSASFDAGNCDIYTDHKFYIVTPTDIREDVYSWDMTPQELVDLTLEDVKSIIEEGMEFWESTSLVWETDLRDEDYAHAYTVEELCELYCNAAHSVGRHLLAQREEAD